MKQFLDKEQAQQLIDMGVDMSSTLMLYKTIEWKNEIPVKWRISAKRVGAKSRKDDTPTLTIGELIERLPFFVRVNGSEYIRCVIGTDIKYRHTGYSEPEPKYEYIRPELINNLYDCYVQLIKDGIVKTSTTNE